MSIKTFSAAVLFLICGQLFSQIPTASLVGYYPFTGNANDVSGNGLNGTANSVTLTTDRFGNSNSAYLFNGTSSYINLPAGSYTTMNVYSYSFWMKPAATGGMPICFGESSFGRCQAIGFNTGNILFAGSYNNGSNPVQSYITSPSVTANQWHHVVVTRDFNSIQLFVNGTQISTVTTANTNGQNADYGNNTPIKAYIGARTLNNSYFNGAIDDVRIWSTAVTQTAVTALYNEACFQTYPTLSYAACAGNSVGLTAIPAPSNTVSWYTSNTSTSAIASGSFFATPTLTTPGTYTYFVGASSCTAYARPMITITVNPNPTLSVSNGTICSGNSFALNPTGASSYTYSSGSQVVSPLSTTNYTITGSSSSCPATNTVVATVFVNTTPTVTVNSGFVCQGNSFTLIPSGALSYIYPGGSPVVTPAANSVYTVIGSNNNGCSSSAVANVGVVANPVITIGGPSQICIGQTATLTASGGNIYTWNIGSSNTVITVSPSSNTSYSVTGVNIFGCVGNASKLITVNPIPVITVNSGSVCSGKVFTMSPTGAATYVYSNGSSTVMPTVNSIYTVTGTSGAGCVSTPVESSVTVVSSPVVAVNSGTLCAGKAFTMTPSGAITYTYSGGSSIVTPATTTAYTVTGANAAGCTGTATAFVVVSPLPIVTITSPSGICSGSSTTLTAGGASTYTWDSGSQTSAVVVSPVSNTTYTVFGTDIYGCINSASKNIVVNPLPSISVNSGSICSGRSFTIVPSGAASYTYSGGSNIVSPLVTTSYSVTGTSSQGCVSSNTAISTVNVVSSPVIALSGGSICIGSSFTLSPSGAVNYTYSGGSQIVSPTANTSYTVTGANGAGCTATAAAIVTVSPLPTLTFNNPGAVCSGNSITITVSGAQTYAWDSGATTSSITVAPTVATIYTVTGINAAGCAKTATTQVNVNVLPVISVNSGAICSGKSFNIIATGATTYTYSGGSSVVTPLSTTSYSVYGTSAQGCVSAAPAISNVTVLALPAVTAGNGTICAGSSFTIIPSGAVSYVYSGGSAIVSPLTNTNYTVTGTGSNGCTNTAVSSVSVNPLPVVSINNPGAVCSGKSITLTASGAASYAWNTGANTAVLIDSPVSATNYTVTGTSSAGCIKTATTSVVVNALPVISVNSGSICSGKSFTIVPTGASTYTYSGGNIVSPSTNTSYSVTGTSAQGCVSSNTAVSNVTVIALPVVSVNSGTMCAGSVFTMIPTGAVAYNFSSGAATVSPTSNANYTVTGTNAQGCVSLPSISSVSVFALPALTVNSGAICAGESFTIVPSGASTYTISGGSSVVNPISTTNYSVSGTSTAGCVSSAFAISTVTVHALPTISVSSGSICMGGSFTLAPSGAFSYTYSSGSNVVSPIVTTTYSITGSSSFGCAGVNTAVATVTVNASPSLTIVVPASVCSGYTANLIAAGAATYSWSNGNTGASITVSPQVTTVYTVNGVSAEGCLSTGSETLVVTPLPTISINSGAVCPGNSFTFTPSGGLTYTYSSGSNIVTPLTTSSYTVFGTDALGCISEFPAVATVSVVNTLTVTISGSQTVCSGSSLVLTANGASTYSWSTGAQFNTINVSPTANTTYSVTGASGTCSDNAVFSVQVIPVPTITVNSGAICMYDSFTISPSGAQSYTYSTGATTSGDIIVKPVSNTNYTVYGASGAGCISNIAISTVTVNSLPNVVVASSNNVICLGDELYLTAAGALNYVWSTGQQGATINFIPDGSKTYTVTGTDLNNCNNTAMISVPVDPCTGVMENSNTVDLDIFPNPNAGTFTVLMQKNTNGQIQITDIQGKVVYTQQLNSNGNAETLTCGLVPGLYFVTITVKGQTSHQEKIIITN